MKYRKVTKCPLLHLVIGFFEDLRLFFFFFLVHILQDVSPEAQLVLALSIQMKFQLYTSKILEHEVNRAGTYVSKTVHASSLKCLADLCCWI